MHERETTINLAVGVIYMLFKLTFTLYIVITFMDWKCVG